MAGVSDACSICAVAKRPASDRRSRWHDCFDDEARESALSDGDT
jgi:hypothetical protein